MHWSGIVLLCSSALAAGTVKGRVVLLDRDGRPREGVVDLVALLEPASGTAHVRPGPRIQIRTVGKRFVPRVAVVTPGTEVGFPNQDHILHNVFSVTPGNAFDTGHYQPGDSPAMKARQPGLVKLFCNVHSNMHAFLWVVTTPWAQVLDASGVVSFQQVPPGAYRLRAWHPEAGEQSWSLQVGPGTTEGAWTLQASRPALEPHKNKFGKDYPPAPDERVY